METNKLNNINIDDICGEILTETEFWHQKAITVWKEWKELDIEKDVLQRLLIMPYDEFCNTDDQIVTEIRKKLFTAVAYFDSKSKDKQQYNEYPDKRTIAQTGIRQDDWVTRLLKFKLDNTDLTEGIRNLIDYLDDNLNNFPIISEPHKKKIYNYFIGEKHTPYSNNQFNSAIHEYFKEYIKCTNPQNYTAAVMRVIYSLRSEWENKPTEIVKGLFVHEKGNWKKEFIEKIGTGKGCLWWHTLPKAHKNENDILTQLANIIDDGNIFELYYIENNKARYKAQVVDFATEQNYTEKYAEWKDMNPLWIENEISDYNDGKHTARFVFLVNEFCELENPIDVNNFLRYKNMSYSTRGGIAAYTKIINDNIKKWKIIIKKK